MLYLAGSTNKVEFDLYLVSYKSYLVSIRIPAYTYTPAETNETNRIIKMQIKRGKPCFWLPILLNKSELCPLTQDKEFVFSVSF